MRTVRGAFTIVELLIAVAVIGVLATLVSVNYTQSRIKAADANIKSGVRSYRQAMELHYAQKKQYFVQDASAGKSCAVTVTPGTGYRLKGEGNGCVGFDGGSQGRMTRRSVQAGSSGKSYKDRSIADVLFDEGVIASIQTYPGVSDFTSLTGGPKGGNRMNDFVLTLCDAQGNQAKSPETALNFAIFAELKNPSAPADKDRANHLCGADGTDKGWNLIDVEQ